MLHALFSARHCDAKVDLLSFFILPKKVGLKMGGGQPCNSTLDPQNAQRFFLKKPSGSSFLRQLLI